MEITDKEALKDATKGAMKNVDNMNSLLLKVFFSLAPIVLNARFMGADELVTYCREICNALVRNEQNPTLRVFQLPLSEVADVPLAGYLTPAAFAVFAKMKINTIGQLYAEKNDVLNRVSTQRGLKHAEQALKLVEVV